jgi:hypothetical protein
MSPHPYTEDQLVEQPAIAFSPNWAGRRSMGSTKCWGWKGPWGARRMPSDPGLGYARAKKGIQAGEGLYLLTRLTLEAHSSCLYRWRTSRRSGPT